MNKNVAYEPLETPRSLLVFLYLGVAIWYLGWRLTTFNPDALTFSWALYAAECFGFATTLLHLFMVWRLSVREAVTPNPDWTVDVFIPTLNEPVELVRRTVLSAIAMDAPHQTWILDDGNRPEMKQLAQELGCEYVARPGSEHAKAGNLNHALSLSRADFIAVFDADHAPKRQFLSRTLGYFHDENVAFVQTPQDFYNLDSFQHKQDRDNRRVWTEQSLFFRVIQRGKDYWNAAFFCGSCAIIRRTSLMSIGGFATGTVTEDLHTSIRLHKEGFKSVYHNETLALGLAPSQLEPFISQRIRWGQGAMQVWKKEGILFSSGLTLAQKLCYFASMITYFDGWQKLVFYVSPVIVLTLGIMPVQTITTEFFLHFIPYIILTFWVFEETGRGFGDSLRIEQYNMSRFAAFAWSTLGLLRRKLSFKVTDKRLTTMPHIHQCLLPQYLVLGGSAIAVGAGIFYAVVEAPHLGKTALLANLFWASVNLLIAGTVINFALRLNSFRRKEYRFPIPLVTKLRMGQRAEHMGSIRNISSSGFQLAGPINHTLHIGETVSGMIYLPDGPLAFLGRIRSLISAPESQTIQALGIEFDWQDQQARDRLDLFLYGSDLQWHLNRLHERAETPLERLLGGFGIITEESMPDNWSSIALRSVNDDEETVQSGAIAVCPDTHKSSLVTYKPMVAGSVVETRIFSGDREVTVRGKVSNEKRLENGSASLYWYDLNDDERNVA